MAFFFPTIKKTRNIWMACLSFIFMINFSCKPYLKKTNTSLISNTEVAKISILGVFHFGGSAGDLASIQMSEPFGKRRQTEIIKLVTQLAQLKPTKILVEYPKNMQAQLDEEYNRYKLGKDTLKVNEVEQLGFRLAKMLGHSKIFAIDHSLNLPFEELLKYCEKNNKMLDFENFINDIKKYVANENKILNTTNISSYLARTNVDSVDRWTNETYIGKILTWGDNTNEAGARIASAWWERNIFILKNIVQTIENKKERILVIVGSAHRALLKNLLINRSDIEYIEIADYLK